MRRLPNATLGILQKALASGRTPDFDQEHHYEVFDAFSELAHTLSDEACDNGAAAMSPPRRLAYGLINFWQAIPADGIVVGIVVNQPEIVPIALEAARSVGMQRAARFIESVAACIPAEFEAMHDVEQRIGWFDTAEGQRAGDKLDELEEAMEEEVVEELLMGGFNIVLASPDEFFEKP